MSKKNGRAKASQPSLFDANAGEAESPVMAAMEAVKDPELPVVLNDELDGPAEPEPPLRKVPVRRAFAESLAEKQREISVSEFFVKNRHLLASTISRRRF